MPIASGKTYAAFLEEQNRRRRQAPLTPVAYDPIDDAGPVEEEQSFTSNLNKYDKQPFSNFGYDVAGDYLSSAGESFKNALTGQGVATMLPEIQFYPGGPTGLEKVYGGIADTTLGLFSTIVAGLGGITGYLAEQVPFQSEGKEDQLSRDLLGSVEYLEMLAAPYLGVPLNFSKIARLGQQSKNLPSMDLRLQDGPEFDASLAELAAAERQQNNTQQPLSLEDLAEFAAAERQRNFAQQPLLLEDLRDAVDPDFVSIEELEDLRINPEQPIDIVDTTPPAGALVDDNMFDDDIFDADMGPDDRQQAIVDLDNDDIFYNDEGEFIPDIDVDLDVDLDDDILDDAAEAADEAARVAENVRIQEARALLPVTSVEDAVNTEQLRELYAKYNLPIPKTEAEQRAANIIIESNNKKNAESKIGTLPPSQRVKFTPPEVFREGVDLDYLKTHAPADVYNKQGPTMLEAKLTEQQEGRLGALPPINSGNDGPRIAPEFYSAAVQAARKLNVKSASYPELKRLMLKQKGVKIKELEWSGADEAFEGRKDVTPQELVEYLEDNTNLIEAKTIQARGLTGEGADYSGNINVLEERYVDRESAELLDQEKEYFLENWEDIVGDYGDGKWSSVQDYVASGNYVALDRFAQTSSVGVETGEELAEKFPEGWIVEKEGNSLVPDGVTLVFGDRDDAANHDWNTQAVDSVREQVQENFRSEIQYAGEDTSQSGKKAYLAMLFPDGDIPDWAKDMYGIIDPDDTFIDFQSGDLTYASYFPQGGTNMRETTYQFRDPTAKLEDDYFRMMHFDESGREDNLVAHARTAEFPVEGGGTAYHVGEAQSDMQQGIRREGTTPRTRDQQVTATEVESINQSIGNMVRNSENVLNKTIFGDDTIGIATAYKRDQYPEDLETYRTIVANFLNSQYGNPDQSMIPQIRYDMDPEHTFFAKNRGNIKSTNSNLNAFAQYIMDNKNTVPTEYVTWADEHINDFSPNISNSYEKLYGATFNKDLSNQQVGAPFVESTDAWVDMVLRRQLADAIESGADYITLPNPRMVKQYTHGDFEGHRQFYGNIAPKNLLNIAKSADPTRNSAIELFPVKIQTDAGLEDVLALPLTPGLIQSLRQKGLPNYMLPLTVGGAASYGTLGSITKDENTGGAI